MVSNRKKIIPKASLEYAHLECTIFSGGGYGLSDGEWGRGINVRFSGFFGNPEKRRKCAFFGISQKSGSGGKCAFFGIFKNPENAHNVRFSGFENFDFFDSQTA